MQLGISHSKDSFPSNFINHSFATLRDLCGSAVKIKTLWRVQNQSWNKSSAGVLPMDIWASPLFARWTRQ